MNRQLSTGCLVWLAVLASVPDAAGRPHAPRYLDCAVDAGNGKAYFFKGTEYVRFDIGADRADPGYPQPITRGWPGLWDRDIDAAFNGGNGKLYFFKGAQYLRYDIATDRADPGFPKPIAGKWPGVWDRDLDAAYNSGNGKAYLFKGDQYVRYDIAADRADPGFPQPIAGKWPGLWPRDVDAAYNAWNGKAYFFKGTEYVRYHIPADRADPGFPKPIAGNWTGLWPIGGGPVVGVEDCPEALVTRAGLQCKALPRPVDSTPLLLPPPPPPAVDVPSWDTGADALPKARRTARGAALSCIQRSGKQLMTRPPPPPVPQLDDPQYRADDTAAGALATLTEAQRRTVKLIDDNRRKLEPFAKSQLQRIADPNTLTNGKVTPSTRLGWSYIGRRQKQWPEGLARTEAEARTPRERQQVAVWEELFREGNVTSIATWDATFSFGAGYASFWSDDQKLTAGDLVPVMQKFFADRIIGPLFRNFGIGMDDKGFRIVNTRTGQVETGADALQMLMCDPVLDAIFVAIGEGNPLVGKPHPDARQLLVNSQWGVTGGGSRAGDVRDYAYAWPRTRVQFLAHAIHLWFYANWSSSAYAGSQGTSDREFLVRLGRALDSGVKRGIRDMGAATSDGSVRYKLLTFGGRANDNAYFNVFGGGGYLRGVVGSDLPLYRRDEAELPTPDGTHLPPIDGVRRGGDPVYLVRDPSPCTPEAAKCEGYSAYYLVAPGPWKVEHVVSSLLQESLPQRTWLLMKYPPYQREAIRLAWPPELKAADEAFFAGAQVQRGERFLTPIERAVLITAASTKYGAYPDIMAHISDILVPK